MQAASWLEHYDEGMPATLGPYPERTLLDDLADAAAERPDGPALLFKGRTVTHRELQGLSDAFAAALAALGVAKGDRVALLLPNTPQFLICELGAWKAGAIVVPLNPIYTEPELAGALTRTGAETIVVLTRSTAASRRSSRAPPCGGWSPPASRSTCRRCCGCCSPGPRSARTATG
ncbi:MAG TPA: AMP-binding protein [Actinomycetes bacterium]